MNKGLRLGVAFISLILLFFLGIAFGAGKLMWQEIYPALFRGETTTGIRILLHVRLPRVLGALLSGAGFAVSGAILQTVLENPLASPNVIGVNSGAGLSLLTASALYPASSNLLIPAAFSGALLAAAMVFFISAGNTFSPLTVVMAGFIISSMFSGGMNVILLVNPDAYVSSGNFLAGGLSGLTLKTLAAPAIYISAGLLLSVLFSPALNILAMGADTASSLGVKVPVQRFLQLALAAILAGAAVSFAGMIGFVGLIAPHTARLVIGHDNRYVLPLSAILGASLVIACDLLARVLFAPFELPVGILLSFTGGPAFLFLLLKNRRQIYD